MTQQKCRKKQISMKRFQPLKNGMKSFLDKNAVVDTYAYLDNTYARC